MHLDYAGGTTRAMVVMTLILPTAPSLNKGIAALAYHLSAKAVLSSRTATNRLMIATSRITTATVRLTPVHLAITTMVTLDMEVKSIITFAPSISMAKATSDTLVTEVKSNTTLSSPISTA